MVSHPFVFDPPSIKSFVFSKVVDYVLDGHQRSHEWSAYTLWKRAQTLLALFLYYDSGISYGQSIKS